MNNFIIYPGTFCPPTYGHFDIALRAFDVFGRLAIVCSENQDKNNIFTSEERKRIWQYYDLPKKIKLYTFAELKKIKTRKEGLIMVRGLRNNNDYEYEKKILFQNKSDFGINKYLFLFSAEKYCCVSSSEARRAAEKKNIRDLSAMITPMIISELLEKTFGLKRLYLVVGRPASGKSTILKRMEKIERNFIHINTDEISDQLKPLLMKRFPDASLIDLAINKEKEIKKILKKPWLEMLSKKLTACPPGSTVFAEVPYGLKPGLDTYRYLGGRVIYFGCQRDENYQRNRERGGGDKELFIDKIPDLETSRQIAKSKKLNLLEFDTSFPFSQIDKRVEEIINRIKKEA